MTTGKDVMFSFTNRIQLFRDNLDQTALLLHSAAAHTFFYFIVIIIFFCVHSNSLQCLLGRNIIITYMLCMYVGSTSLFTTNISYYLLYDHWPYSKLLVVLLEFWYKTPIYLPTLLYKVTSMHAREIFIGVFCIQNLRPRLGPKLFIKKHLFLGWTLKKAWQFWACRWKASTFWASNWKAWVFRPSYVKVSRLK